MKYHIAKDGRRIPLEKLDINHLKNIINMIERKAAEGITVGYGDGYIDEDMYYDEETFKGEAALKLMHYDDYKAELARRLNEKLTMRE